MAKNNVTENKEQIIETYLEDEMANGFIEYAEELIINRSIPSIYDGLKPVMRRILYAMYELKVFSEGSHKKSARVVGEVLGKYHPHGDTAVYDAMVRMGQDWIMRIPLINIHGNGGSIDGDSPAAMRYTEVKLTEFVTEFVRDLSRNAVRFVDNFDGEEKEPELLPTIIPNYLLNGGTGIAVGVSCDIPPHNLIELIQGIIAYIENPAITNKELMKYIKGPDFPTGGIIEGANLEKIYSTGKGTFKVRAKHKIEELKSGKINIVITEIPYQTTKGKILSDLANLYMDKQLDGVTDIRDETTLEDGIRIIIEIKKEVDPNYILKIIFKKTSLEVTQKFNLRAVINDELRLISLTDYMAEYLKFQKDIMYKKTQYLITEAEKELIILEGYITCIKNVDRYLEVVRACKSKNDAKLAIMKEFSLNEEQSSAVLDLRVYKLTVMEMKAIEKDKSAKAKELKDLKKVVSSDKQICDEIKKQLLQISEKYGDKRRSKIQRNFNEIEAEKPVVDFNVVIKDKIVKVYQTKNFKLDGGILVEMDNTKDLILIAQSGDLLKFPPDKIPNKVPLNIVGAFASDFKEDNRVLTLITKDGMIKRSEVSEYNIKRSQSSAINLENKDELIFTHIGTLEEENVIIVISNNNDYNMFDIKSVTLTGRTTKGVRAIKNKESDFLKGVYYRDQLNNIVLVGKLNEVPISISKLEISEVGNRHQLIKAAGKIAKKNEIIDIKINLK